MRYRMELSYDGSAFRGWQRQPDAPSVQGTIETALKTLLHEEIQLTGAGRTDTGVHASAYTAHFDAETEFERTQLAYKLNSILPTEIAIKSISPANPDFHARFDAVKREYIYLIHRKKNPFLRNRSYYFGYPDMDFEAMNRAASLLKGTHDFSAFEKTGADNKTSVCTVFEARWSRLKESGLPFGTAESECWCFRISADRFLRNMVRAIVGSLLEVGRGKRTEENFGKLMDATVANARSLAGESVPAHALYLNKIEY